MIGLANWALLGGFIAVAAPVLLHIAHRRRFYVVQWGAMRFLAAMWTARKRRLQFDQWFLLALRCTILALVAAALCRPFWSWSQDQVGVERQGAVAAVVMIDDSLSTHAGRQESTFSLMQDMTERYLATLGKGDEVSVIVGSRSGEAAADPFFDVAAAQEVVANLQPSIGSTDMVRLIEAGLRQLTHHVNPHAEIVLVTDGAADGWHDELTERWNDVRQRLQNAAVGKLPPRVVVLVPDHEPQGLNASITAIRTDRSLIPVGRSVGIGVTLQGSGSGKPEQVALRVSVNGRQIDERPITIEPGLVVDTRIPHVFPDPGSYIIEARIDGARDTIAADDQRALSVQVESGVRVVLVEGEVGQGITDINGSLGYVAVALDQDGTGSGLFQVERISAADFSREDVVDARVIILGDVPALEPATVAALEAFVVAGGGVLVGLGPHMDLPLANRFWTRGGHGFLPVQLTGLIERSGPSAVHMVQDNHPALAPFMDAGDSVWNSVRLRQQVRFHVEAHGSANTMRLLAAGDQEDVLVIARRGYGQVAVLATTLNDQWTDFPHQAAFVPFIRGMVAELAAVLLPPRNIRPGERLNWMPGQGQFQGLLDVTGPDGQGRDMSEGVWEGRRAFFSKPVYAAGDYHVRGPGVDVHFAVASDPDESALHQVDAVTMTTCLGSSGVVLQGSQSLRDAYAGGRRQPIEMWRYFIGLALVGLIIESWATARARRRSQGSL